MTLMFIDATRIPPRIMFLVYRNDNCAVYYKFLSRRVAAPPASREIQLELRPGLEPPARVETHRVGDGGCDREELALDIVAVI